MQLRKIFLWSMIVSLALAALLGIAALLLPRYGPDEQVLVSVALFAVFSLVALVTASLIERKPPWVWLMRAGLVTAALGLVGWLVLVWFDRALNRPIEEIMARGSGTLSVLAVLAPQCGLLLLAQLESPRTRLVRTVTIAVSILLAAYSVTLILSYDLLEKFIDDDTLFRGLGVLIILAACGTVITPILWKMQRVRHGGDGAVPVVAGITLVCPRCRKQQMLPTGPARCGTCGLQIRIEVEDPRCECGYVLHGLDSDRCPECGKSITASPQPSAG